MRLRYLPTAEPGLRWFRVYYRKNPQLDRANAIDALRRAEAMLVEFPFSGAVYEDFEAVREQKILHTPFSLLYSVARETVWIIDLRDQRGQRNAEALGRFLDGLRRRPP
jgi:ParE toxin of type II toxin-antitoxin system, parDE